MRSTRRNTKTTHLYELGRCDYAVMNDDLLDLVRQREIKEQVETFRRVRRQALQILLVEHGRHRGLPPLDESFPNVVHDVVTPAVSEEPGPRDRVELIRDPRIREGVFSRVARREGQVVPWAVRDGFMMTLDYALPTELRSVSNSGQLNWRHLALTSRFCGVTRSYSLVTIR